MDETSRPYKPNDQTIATAKANITKLRMRDVELRIATRDGKPLANTPVTVVQTRGAFLWGDQLWGMDRHYRFNEFDTDRGRYKKLRFKNLLNAANALCYWTERPRNDGPKSEDLQGEPQMDGFAACVDWANSEGMTVKGHPLFWSIEKCVPDWVKRYPYETQMKFAEVRVRNLVARFKGKVKLWDAVNEPMWEPAFKNLPNRHWPHLDPISDIADYIEPVLRWCREEDPDAAFIVNDYGMEADPENGAPKSKDGIAATAGLQRKRFLELLKELHRRGTPPSALGLQSHTGGWLDHDTQWAVYDEMSTSGLPVHITEFWADTGWLTKQGKLPADEIENLAADYVTNYMTCAFGHPAIEAFFFWGMMNSAVKWREHSGHDLTVMYHRIHEKLRKEWLTSATLTTDSEGRVKFRGYFGDYSVRYALSSDVTSGQTFTVAAEDSMPLMVKVAAPIKR